jgi:exo-beta-1,3-glucanase (GH17 family)
MRPLIVFFCAIGVLLAWYVPNRPRNPPGGGGEKFSSLSFSAYRAWESPLADRFPTQAEADQDMALVAKVSNAVRTYSAVEGDLDVAALAQKHGVKLWQGIWLGADRAKNDIEIARAIALAHKYPNTIIRVVVGNEVLLRRDLPPAELIAYIDRVKHAVTQPVAYADVWNFWLQFPQIAPHVDIMLIHLLPYWEDIPTGIDHAVDEVGDVYTKMVVAFPGKQIAIGETGWPSRGRQRGDAVPSRVNETRFLRGFLTLAQQQHFDYNFIEAFDQVWKYRSEGIVGASWGIFDAARREKIPLAGPVSNDPAWPLHAVLSIAAGLLLTALGLYRSASLPPTRRNIIAIAGMALGCALVFAAVVAWQTMYDIHLAIAAAVNVPAQAALAILAMLRLRGAIAAAPERNGAAATEAVRGFFRQARKPFFLEKKNQKTFALKQAYRSFAARLQSDKSFLVLFFKKELLPSLPCLHGAFEDLTFLFIWTAAVMQLLLLCDGRYREFPLSTFAVPILVTLGRLACRDLPRTGGGREEFVAGVVLAGAALGSAILEGPLNMQSLQWNTCAVVLSLPPLLRISPEHIRPAKITEQP